VSISVSLFFLPCFQFSLNTEQIEQWIPHRPPFLWLDEVIAVDGQRLQARKYVDPALDVFRGHYPQFPVLPGVLLCEAAFQAGAVLIAHVAPPAPGQVPVVTRVSNVQFRQLVRPGDTLEIEVELTERLANAFYFKGKVQVRGKTAARLEFTCAATEAAAE
jgi:3-hydroxyacyl-[acyl-carrier-protein] dehydratase